MKTIVRLRPSGIIAVLALVVACTGTAIAAATITGKNVKNESLTGKDVRNESLTGKDVRERTLALPPGPVGPPGRVGPPGLRGPEGPQGPPATSLWAKVDADPEGATLINQSGATAASRIALGIFQVDFDRPNVDGCAAVATRTDNADGVAAAGEVGVEQASANSPSIWVRTFNSAGTAADPSGSDGFVVHLYC